MTLSPRLIWTTRISTFAIWLLVGFSLIFWFLRGINAQSVPNNSNAPVLIQNTAFNPENILKALGSSGLTEANGEATSSDALAGRVKLMGVLSFTNGTGAALLSIDSESADPYKIGEEVLDGWNLQSIEARRVVLASKANPDQTTTIELPEPNSNSNSTSTIEDDLINGTRPNVNLAARNAFKNNLKSNTTAPTTFNNNARLNNGANGNNVNLPNAGNGIDANAPNPVLNADPNRAPVNPNPEPIVVKP
jgi:general secretion pathway protein C